MRTDALALSAIADYVVWGRHCLLPTTGRCGIDNPRTDFVLPLAVLVVDTLVCQRWAVRVEALLRAGQCLTHAHFGATYCVSHGLPGVCVYCGRGRREAAGMCTVLHVPSDGDLCPVS